MITYAILKYAHKQEGRDHLGHLGRWDDYTEMNLTEIGCVNVDSSGSG